LVKNCNHIECLVRGGLLISLWFFMSFNGYAMYQQKSDSLANKQDSIPPVDQTYKPSARPTFNSGDRLGDPFSNKISSSPLLFGNPANLKLQYDIDTSFNYTISERMGAIYYRPISSISFSEYDKYQTDMLLKSYWKGRGAEADGETALTGRRLIPKIYISPVFDRIFGGSYVEINPRGLVNLDFGGKFQRIHNPSLPLRQQKNGGFEFDQQISMNVVGKIGEKLKVTANFDNNNSFDFQNNLKVEFTGFEEDIIKKLEIGNVSMPISNGLISGVKLRLMQEACKLENSILRLRIMMSKNTFFLGTSLEIITKNGLKIYRE